MADTIAAHIPRADIITIAVAVLATIIVTTASNSATWDQFTGPTTALLTSFQSFNSTGASAVGTTTLDAGHTVMASGRPNRFRIDPLQRRIEKLQAESPRPFPPCARFSAPGSTTSAPVEAESPGRDEVSRFESESVFSDILRQ